MRLVIQRVKESSCVIDQIERSSIKHGLLILVGIEPSDTMEDVDWLAGKVSRIRLFDDESGVMNRSVVEAKGEILIISQFTLFASTKKGNRPSYIRAARPEVAIPLYESFIYRVKELTQVKVETGVFGAMMDISLINDGPVTIIIDSLLKE
ncbi:MAG: D-aminoacyl-tRNA deacylase [Sphingobacteriia bacterium]|nr:D-aminoacyl-tRNA deacylase [Sphingobacteriia bacterium]